MGFGIEAFSCGYKASVCSRSECVDSSRVNSIQSSRVQYLERWRSGCIRWIVTIAEGTSSVSQPHPHLKKYTCQALLLHYILHVGAAWAHCSYAQVWMPAHVPMPALVVSMNTVNTCT
eukprot:364639-Chlamydomonas_euryale.AAC.46